MIFSIAVLLVGDASASVVKNRAQRDRQKYSSKKATNGRSITGIATTQMMENNPKSVIRGVTFSVDGNTALIDSPHWLHGEGEVPRGKSPEAKLAVAKNAWVSGDGESCLKAIAATGTKLKTVQVWVAAQELLCATQIVQVKPTQLAVDRLHEIMIKIERNVVWLTVGVHVEGLRSALIKGYVTTLDFDFKNNHARTIKSVERLEQLAGFADAAVRAKTWRMAAELAFSVRDAVGARELLKRSLAEEESTETRGRLLIVERMIQINSRDTAPTTKSGEVKSAEGAVTNGVSNSEIEASKEELELTERAIVTLKAGDLVIAVDDLTKLLREYPGGTRAKWASDRVLEVYWSIAEKNDLKLALSRAQILKKMESVDGERLGEWGRNLFARGQWADALTLTEEALDKVDGSRRTALLELAGKSSLASDQFAKARKYFDNVILTSAGTQAARETLLRSGLLHFRLKDYSRAVGDFERLLAVAQIGTLELPSRYWLWRSLERLKSERAVEAADELMRKYPFSYYGLRARYERTEGALEWKTAPGKFSIKLFLTAGQRAAWERTQILLRAGWLDEAQLEMQSLPMPQKAEEKAVRALLWAAAGVYTKATKLANEAWDEIPDLRRPPLVRAAFPRVFSQLIDTQADLRKLDRDLVRGLVKQESSFNQRAVSTSNAYGLMQIIGPTAREIAQDLKVSPLSLPEDLFQPTRNVEFGTYYLARLVQKYSGHVPLALAAYNAGPTRIDRWLKGRASLQNLSTLRSSQPEDELWIDELPYSEPSIYVKAILRNILIYKMLDNGRVQVSEPIWSDESNKL
jgi:soluble lytic murein transglycosylase